MRYRVIGTDQTSRKPIDTVIDAPSLERAGMLAKMKKINVASIEPMDEAIPTATLNYARPTRRKSKMSLLIIVALIVIALLAGGFLAGLIDF